MRQRILQSALSAETSVQGETFFHSSTECQRVESRFTLMRYQDLMPGRQINNTVKGIRTEKKKGKCDAQIGKGLTRAVPDLCPGVSFKSRAKALTHVPPRPGRSRRKSGQPLHSVGSYHQTTTATATGDAQRDRVYNTPS